MLAKLPAFIGRTLSRVRPGLDRVLSAHHGLATVPVAIALESPAFAHGRELPVRFTADGEGTSPPLAWTGVPDGARSLILVVEDADSPTPSPLVHLIATGIPITHTSLAEGELVAPHDGGPVLGKTSFLRAGWLPPDPPPGHGVHRYCFQLFALDYGPQFEGHPGRGSVIKALEGHVLARGQLIGTYRR